MKIKCKKHGIQACFKSGRTLKSILVAPEKDTIKQKIESHVGIDAVGWTMMMNTLGNLQELLLKVLREHLRAPSPKFEHQSNTGHNTKVDYLSIVGGQGHNFA